MTEGLAEEVEDFSIDDGRGYRWGDLISPAAVAGFVDAGIVLLYARGLNAGFNLSKTLELWYLFGLLSKLVMLAIARNERVPLSSPARWLIGSTTAMAVATTITGVDSFMPYIAVGAFIAHMYLTSALMGTRPLRVYLLGPLLIIGPSAAVHAALCFTHRMPTWWGRFYYFSYNQYNLGGEIEAIGCVAAALAVPRLTSLLFIAVMLIDINYMQARSALLVGLGCVAAVLAFDANHRLSPQRLITLALLLPVATLLLVATGVGGKLGETLSNMLLLNDQNRGLGSGASGRGDLWEWSLQLFLQSPIFGHSLSYFQSIGFIGSHNIFFYGLAQYGAMSLLFFGTLIYAYALVALRDPYRFAVLLTVLPLLLFNDRFVNLNAYPFIFFVLLTAPTREQSEDDADVRCEALEGEAAPGPARSWRAV